MASQDAPRKIGSPQGSQGIPQSSRNHRKSAHVAGLIRGSGSGQGARQLRTRSRRVSGRCSPVRRTTTKLSWPAGRKRTMSGWEKMGTGLPADGWLVRLVVLAPLPLDRHAVDRAVLQIEEVAAIGRPRRPRAAIRGHLQPRAEFDRCDFDLRSGRTRPTRRRSSVRRATGAGGFPRRAWRSARASVRWTCRESRCRRAAWPDAARGTRAAVHPPTTTRASATPASPVPRAACAALHPSPG